MTVGDEELRGMWGTGAGLSMMLVLRVSPKVPVTANTWVLAWFP